MGMCTCDTPSGPRSATSALSTITSDSCRETLIALARSTWWRFVMMLSPATNVETVSFFCTVRVFSNTWFQSLRCPTSAVFENGFTALNGSPRKIMGRGSSLALFFRKYLVAKLRSRFLTQSATSKMCEAFFRLFRCNLIRPYRHSMKSVTHPPRHSATIVPMMAPSAAVDSPLFAPSPSPSSVTSTMPRSCSWHLISTPSHIAVPDAL
mmetsp:Transcript_37523/g.88318  ORF Transcript_37523/g.88318 Transcript_37523/m.88318 type:complete len:209 (-) Transcript_37523:303-929(-)